MGALEVHRCPDCGRTHLEPHPCCPHCGGGMAAAQVSGRGRIYSFTRVFVGPKGWECPYVLALIDLEEGGRVLANLAAEGGATAHVGAGVCYAGRVKGAALFRLLESEG